MEKYPRDLPTWGRYLRWDGADSPEGPTLSYYIVRLALAPLMNLRSQFPWRIDVRVPMKFPGKLGVGDSYEEISRCIRLAESIRDSIWDPTRGLHAGTTGSEGYWYYKLYVINSNYAHLLNKAFPPETEFGVNTASDPEWKEYWEWIYPHRTMDLMQIFIDEQIREFVSTGDNPDVPHVVRHYIFAQSEDSVRLISDWAKHNRFEVACGALPRAYGQCKANFPFAYRELNPKWHSTQPAI